MFPSLFCLLYPGSESNRYGRNGHRILSPEKHALKHFLNVQFPALGCIFEHFRTPFHTPFRTPFGRDSS